MPDQNRHLEMLSDMVKTGMENIKRFLLECLEWIKKKPNPLPSSKEKLVDKDDRENKEKEKVSGTVTPGSASQSQPPSSKWPS